mgnify:CR=1 FL=1
MSFLRNAKVFRRVFMKGGLFLVTVVRGVLLRSKQAFGKECSHQSRVCLKHKQWLKRLEELKQARKKLAEAHGAQVAETKRELARLKKSDEKGYKRFETPQIFPV